MPSNIFANLFILNYAFCFPSFSRALFSVGTGRLELPGALAPSCVDPRPSRGLAALLSAGGRLGGVFAGTLPAPGVRAFAGCWVAGAGAGAGLTTGFCGSTGFTRGASGFSGTASGGLALSAGLAGATGLSTGLSAGLAGLLGAKALGSGFASSGCSLFLGSGNCTCLGWLILPAPFGPGVLFARFWSKTSFLGCGGSCRARRSTLGNSLA